MSVLHELDLRANIKTYPCNDKRLVLYDDHRYLLNVIFILRKNGFINSPIDLVYFDYHEDRCPAPDSVKKKSKDFDIENTTLEEFFSITEFDLNPLDDNWLLTGMEFNLIQDAVVIGAEEKNSTESHVVYTDQSGNDHNFYSISHLSYSLGSRGCLGDSFIKQPYFNLIRDFFCYNTDSSDSYTVDIDRPFILDFDLDCFSADFKDKRMAWPEDIFHEEIFTRVGHNGISSYNFIQQLIQDSVLITICRENGSCGGLGEAFRILSFLDKYLFEGALKTNRCT